jgi:hypothetical protein
MFETSQNYLFQCDGKNKARIMNKKELGQFEVLVFAQANTKH